MYQNIDENFIKKVLQEHDEKLRIISDRTFNLYKESEHADSIISEVAYRQRADFNERKAKTVDGLEKTMQKHVDLVRERSKEIQSILWQLTEEQETINRIWVCFNHLSGKEYQIIYELYVLKNRYIDVEINSGSSHRIFEKIRSEAIQKIINLYNTEYTNLEIVRQYTSQQSNSEQKHTTT